VPDSADTPPPAAACRAITHFLSAVHQALDLPALLRRKDQLPYLKLLDQRARLAHAGIVLERECSGVLHAAAGGDEGAFARLYHYAHPLLLRYLRVVARDAAEDVAAEV
jgi:hypothetical protein